MNKDKFSSYFNKVHVFNLPGRHFDFYRYYTTAREAYYVYAAYVFNAPGRRFEVDVYYTADLEADYVYAACVIVLQIHALQPQGDNLVFFIYQDKIEAAEELLCEGIKDLGTKLRGLMIAPIYPAYQ